MLIIIVFVVSFIVAYWFGECYETFHFYKKFKRGFFSRFKASLEDELGYIVAGVVATAIVSMIVMLTISSIYCETRDPKYKIIKHENLYALEDSPQSTYLFRRSTEKDETLFYVIEDEYGFKIKSVSAEHAHIQYTEDNPRLKIYRGEFSNPYLKYVLFNGYKDHYIFYVPYDSIKSDYNIDLKSGG